MHVFNTECPARAYSSFLSFHDSNRTKAFQGGREMMRRTSYRAEVLVSKPVAPPFHENPNRHSFSVSSSSRNHERELICVTSGTSYLGLRIVKQLLNRGCSVRITTQKSDLEDSRETEELRDRLEGIVEARMDDLLSLCEAFEGCHAVFHTSSFIDPHGVSGYSEQMAILEAQGAENVIEACAISARVKRCVLTSSLLASVWQREPSGGLLDESCWSDPGFCRDNKLWLALGKTMAEKIAWRVSEERKVRLVTVCPALVTGPDFLQANYTASIAYVKGGRMMLERGLLASVDVDKVAEAHVHVYEAMNNGSCGRYICFERAICKEEEAIELENKLKMHGRLSGRGEAAVEHIPCILNNAKLAKLMANASKRLSCN